MSCFCFQLGNTRLGFVSRLIVLPAFSAINTFFRRSNSHSSKLQGIERWLIALKPFFLFFVQSNQPETHFKLKNITLPSFKIEPHFLSVWSALHCSRSDLINQDLDDQSRCKKRENWSSDVWCATQGRYHKFKITVQGQSFSFFFPKGALSSSSSLSRNQCYLVILASVSWNGFVWTSYTFISSLKLTQLSGLFQEHIHLDIVIIHCREEGCQKNFFL